MSEPAPGGATRAETPPPDPRNASTGELVGSLSEQLGTLVRDEVRLAQAEITRKAKRLGLGAGLLARRQELPRLLGSIDPLKRRRRSTRARAWARMRRPWRR